MNAPVFPHVLRKPLPAEFVDALQAMFGARLSTADAVREHHGRDESPYPPMPPDAVVFATSTDEVVALVNLCARHRVPLIPFGVGSSLEGHLLALHGGISVDLSRMNQVVAINPEDLTVTVQAGVTRKQLNQELRDTGFFFPIDPGADATIGGMTATGASGTNAVRYGTMRENVLALTVVTGEGKVVRTARRAKKSSAGYDLTRLFVGSEGTLGIVTRAILRLVPAQAARSTMVATFPDVDSAARAVVGVSSALRPAMLELMDSASVNALEDALENA